MPSPLRIAGLALFSLTLVSCSTNRVNAPSESDTGPIPVISIVDGQGTLLQGIRFAHYESPVYPRLARQAGLEGTVVIEAEIDPQGKPTSVTVATSSGTQSLDDAAIRAGQKCRYMRLNFGGPTVSCVVQYTVVFELY